MTQNKETEYDRRLAGLAESWFQQAQALDVYLQYEFTGVTAAAGRSGVLEAVDALVTRIIQISSSAPEQEDRWLTLTVDRQLEGLRLVCSSSRICPAELAPLAELGAVTELNQNPDLYEFTVSWKAPKETGGGAPC